MRGPEPATKASPVPSSTSSRRRPGPPWKRCARVVVTPAAPSPVLLPIASTIAPEPDTVGAEADLVSEARMLIADRLAEVAEQDRLDPTDVRDAFRTPAVWFSRESGTANPVKSPGERFREIHRLNAVLAAGREGHVIIDGRRLLIGQELDGFTLISVGERTAVLVSEQEGVKLQLER